MMMVLPVASQRLLPPIVAVMEEGVFGVSRQKTERQHSTHDGRAEQRWEETSASKLEVYDVPSSGLGASHGYQRLE